MNRWLHLLSFAYTVDDKGYINITNKQNSSTNSRLIHFWRREIETCVLCIDHSYLPDLMGFGISQSINNSISSLLRFIIYESK